MNRLICASVVVSAAAAQALGGISYSGSQLTENFDTLPISPPSAASTALFSTTVGVQSDIPGLLASTWQGAKFAGTSTTTLMPFIIDTGVSGTGGIFSYGASLTATERALGALASGANTAAFGVEIVNNSPGTLSEFTVTFTGEEYKRAIPSTSTGASAASVLAFAYGVSGGGITSTNFLTSALMTANTAGDVVGTAPLAFGGSPVTFYSDLGTVSVTVTGLSVAVGDSIFIRWSDFNDAGNDGGVAIDNFTFNAIPAPGAAALLGLSGLLAARRRR